MSLKMANVGNEVIQKLRTDIRTKLDQIGAFVDNELPDYIMVMVANQKTRYQMKDDLSLFLGKDTDDFVNWLHESLKNMQLKVIGDDKKSNSSKKDPDTEVTNVSLKSKDKLKRKTIHEKVKINKSDSIKEKNEEIKQQKEDNNAHDNDNQLSNEKDNCEKELDNSLNMIHTDIESEPQLNSQTEQESEVILELKPDAGDGDELLQENDDPVIEVKQAKVKPMRRVKAEPQRKSAITAPSSTIGAVLHHPIQEDDDDVYDPTRPIVGNVASVVKISDRKSSVPFELQANKLLLLRAVNDAHKSIVGKKRKFDDEIEYTPTPIKQRIGEKKNIIRQYVTIDDDDNDEELHPEDLRNYLKFSKKENTEHPPIEMASDTDQRIVTQTINKPRFVVTLDGVDHDTFLKDRDAELLLDEDMDEELIENEETMEDEANDSDSKINERCKYWPSCKNGDKCEYHHPTTQCKAFPNCRFGDKCLFIHPNCKFDSMCSRKDCPFTHASKRNIPNSPPFIKSNLLSSSGMKQCKYFPNCKNPACPYFHPKNCHFGAKCRSSMCPYAHPHTSYVPSLASVPPSNRMKWNAKDHISERQFSLEKESEPSS